MSTSDERWAGLAAVPKEQRSCCAEKRDDLGRLPIGWCGPDCEGRTSHLAFLAEQRQTRPSAGTKVLEVLLAGPRTISDVSDALGYSSAYASQLVNDLAAAGLVEATLELRPSLRGPAARLWRLASCSSEMTP